MKVIFTLMAAMTCLITALSAPAQQTAKPQLRVVGYAPNWKEGIAYADTIDYARLTHLNIAFENPINDKGDLSYNINNDALIAKARQHHIPVLLSIGGGFASEDKTLQARYFDLLTDANRAGFVAKLAAYVSQHHFDGLDVDLEGSAINDDYGAFIHDLAGALKPKGKLLTAALSQGNGGNRVKEIVLANFDWVNIMAYDAVGSWHPKEPGQHSSMDFAKSTVEAWLKQGLPREKAVLGVPFYGYGFNAAFRDGGYTYAEIVKTYPGAENRDQVGSTIWYNGLATIKAKAEYVKAKDLGGVMIWSLDQDASGNKSLLAAITKGLAQKVSDKKPRAKGLTQKVSHVKSHSH